MWAYNRGMEGVPLYESRDAAAEIGSIVHQWIENDLHGDDFTSFIDSTTEDKLQQAHTAFDAYLKWRDQTGVDVISTETPLVSEVHKYAGTLDAVAEVGGDVVLLDWKTSGGTYPDYIAQIAAYRELLRENGGPPVREAYLLRIGKEHGDFHVHYWTSNILDLGWEWFLAAKRLHELNKTLKSVAS